MGDHRDENVPYRRRQESRDRRPSNREYDRDSSKNVRDSSKYGRDSRKYERDNREDTRDRNSDGRSSNSRGDRRINTNSEHKNRVEKSTVCHTSSAVQQCSTVCNMNSTVQLRSTACDMNSTLQPCNSVCNTSSAIQQCSTACHKSSTICDNECLPEKMIRSNKYRSLEEDLQLMEVYGDDELKHFINFKEEVSRDCNGHTSDKISIWNKEVLDVRAHESHTFHRIVNEIVHPPDDSERDVFIENSICNLKEQEKKKAKEENVKGIFRNARFYVKACMKYDSRMNGEHGFENIACLLDTTLESNVISMKLINRLNINLEPYDHSVHPVTGQNKLEIKGTVHLELNFKTNKNKYIRNCLRFNAMELEGKTDVIFGADFLFNTKGINSINPDCITWVAGDNTYSIGVYSEKEISVVRDISVPTIKKEDIVFVKCSHFRDSITSKKDTVQNFSFQLKGDLSNETLPNSEELFKEYQVLDKLDESKKYTINDGDFSYCPHSYRDTLMGLLRDFKDRFLESDLDIELVSHYEAEIDTVKDKKLCEKANRIPSAKFDNAQAAIKQLETAGIISISDSAWRSNVVLIPRNDDKSTKLRVGLDFKELNNILVYPEDVKFATLDEILTKLKGKVVVRLDLSAIYSMIPIRPEDKYKTSFWLNDLSYELNVLVKSIKSSYAHIQKLFNVTFSDDVLFEYAAKLSSEERKLLPLSFKDIIVINIDDAFIFAYDIDSLLVCLKLVLMVARDAKIKFSIEKSIFVTTQFQIAGYAFDTKQASLTMDKIKSSALLNMKKPTSLYELHNRICVFSYHSRFLPYLKHILYPLNLLIKNRKFVWTEIEEEAWNHAKTLCSLNLRLTVPNAEDDLVLATDASKIAASACLFRVNNGDLDLVSVNSKCFSTTDMHRSSYTLESIALAYGLKACASYILNCKGTVKLFTDSRSLLYAKRHHRRNFLINSTLNYIENFISMANIQIYHVPGELNICADVFSRAISENLNCGIKREHPISKKWAAVLPPIPDNFSVDNETLYKFLTNPLKSEIVDTYDKSQRRLIETRSVQTWFDLTNSATSEKRFNDALNSLEEWNREYSKKQRYIMEIKGNLDMQRQRACLAKIQELVEKMYGDIKNTRLYKKVKASLVEATKDWMKVKNGKLSTNSIKISKESVKSVTDAYLELIDKEKSKRDELEKVQADLNHELMNGPELKGEISADGIRIAYMLSADSYIHPRMNDMGYLEIPLQCNKELKPNEIGEVDLGIKFGVPKGYKICITRATGLPSCIYGPMELSNDKDGDYFRVAIQNISVNKVTLTQGTWMLQIIVRKCHTPNLSMEWNELESRLGATCKKWMELEHAENSRDFSVEFYNVTNKDELLQVRIGLRMICPNSINIGSFKINFLDSLSERRDHKYWFQVHERRLIKYFGSSCQYKSFFPFVNSNFKSQVDGDNEISCLSYDLKSYRKIEQDELVTVQNKDERVALIKEALCVTANVLKNTTGMERWKEKYHDDILFKKYTMRSGIVFRKFFSKKSEQTFLTVYVPTCILEDVILHTHLKESHPSGRQTYRIFSESFYHPQAQKIARRLCRSCPHCMKERQSSESIKRVPKNKVLKPSKPREGLSLDIVPLPETKDGYSYGLLIVDLLTLYVSFYPLKNNDGKSVESSLKKYFALHGVPKSIYTENCRSFRSCVDILLSSCNITHVTSNEYKKGRMTNLESQVITLRNAYRTTILESKFFQGSTWNEIYPIILCKLNAAITKLGINRESFHYGQIVESYLPVLSDLEIFGPLEEEFDQVCKRFRDKMGRFMGKKKRKKRKDNGGKVNTSIYMHEIVMREVFLENEAGRSIRTYTGPYRVIGLCSKGVELRDMRNGDLYSVAFAHVRKLRYDELFTLLPQHMEDKLVKALGIISEDSHDEISNESTEKAENGKKGDGSQYVPPRKLGTLQPGKLYTVAIGNIPSRLRSCVRKATWRTDKPKSMSGGTHGPSSIVRMFMEEPPLSQLVYQEWNEDQKIYKMYDTNDKRCYSFCEDQVARGKGRKDYKGNRFVSSFQSEKTGTLRLLLKREIDRGKDDLSVRFSDVTVYFY